MASIGQAAAEGLQAGFGMGLQFDQQKEAKRARAVSEAQQVEEMGLRKQHLAEQSARQAKLDARQTDADEYQALKDAHADIMSRAEAYTAQGQELPPELAQQYGESRRRMTEHRDRFVAPKLAAERQGALDFFSGVQAGRVDPLADDVTPAQLYRHISLATGRTPEQITQAATGARQIQEGLQTGNHELMLRGVNALAAPDLRAGVGQESPHGGVIVKKEVNRLVPVRDANGVEHPDKVFPIIRVFVDKKGPDGQNLYYDAPLTENRSSDPDDPVKAIDLKRAFDYMGNVGTLAAALQDPRAAAKLARGAQEAGAQTQADLDELNALGRAGAAKHAQAGLTRDLLAIRNDPVLTDEQKQEAIDIRLGRKAKPIAAQVGGLAATHAAIDKLPVSDARKLELKEQAVPGGARAKGGAGKGTGVSGGAAAKPVSDKFAKDPEYAKQVDTWAELVAKGGDLPAGFARANKGMYADILARAPLLAASGATGMMADRAAYTGMKAGSRAVETRAANFGLAKSEAYEMADLVTEASASVPRTSFIPVNKALNSFNTNSGDVKVRQFGASINSFINAYARAVSPIGTPTVSDKNHARDMLSAADSHEQVVGIIAQLKKEMVAAGNAPRAVRGEQSEAVRGLGGGAPKAPTPQDQAAIEWAKSNPRDPRAAKILQMHGM